MAEAGRKNAGGRLEGRIAIITGAGQGIGAGIADVMIREGATLIVTDRTAEKFRDAVPGAAAYVELDVTDSEQWASVAWQIERDYGRLDILVNNAGIAECVPFEETSTDIWRRHMAVNAEGPFLGIKALLPLLRKHGGDSKGESAVVNIVSVAAKLGLPDQCAYNASKAALQQLTRSLAVEFATKAYSIRVNSILPGRILTPMTERVLREREKAGVVETIRIAPMGGGGTPEDIGYGVVYLASPESAFVTGTEMVIDGAWSVW